MTAAGDKAVVLMAGDNIHGRILVQAMVDNGCAPALVINEAGSPRAEKLSNFLENDFYNPPSVTASGAPVRAVGAFDSADTMAIINAARPSFLINGGCGIWRKTLLEAARPLNVHPGLLPAYRGLDPVLWSLLHGDPVGATVHVMDDGIDTGDILLSRPMPPRNVRSVLELRLHCMRWGAELLVEFLKDPKRFPPRQQDREAGQYFGAFPEDRLPEIASSLDLLQRGPHGQSLSLNGTSVR